MTNEDAMAGTEWGVLYPDITVDAQAVWLAEDEHEARYEATRWEGKMMKRTVGPWEVSE
jgi:hypothetical protein